MTATNDHIGNVELAKKGVLTGELSFYALSVDEVKRLGTSSGDEMIAIPPVDDVISCYYFPYMNYNGLGTTDVWYDYQAYPLPSNDEQLQKDLILHRVNHVGTNSLSDVGRYDKWSVKNTDIGGQWRWENEGKLWLPPYTTIVAFDGLTEPMEINPLLFKNDLDTFAISCRHSLNHLGAYTLYVEGYRGDSLGKLYGWTSTGLSFPIMSNSYTEYLHHNQFALKNERWKRATSGMMNVVSGMINQDWSGVVSTVANTYLGHQAMKGQINQAKLSGYQLTGEGSNALHDMQMNGGMQVVHQQYLPEYMQQIGYYFHQFGYAQNKIMTPNINSRKYFNYLKGDITLSGLNVPPQYMSELTRTFIEGATIWHMDLEENFIGNYLPDNVEV